MLVPSFFSGLLCWQDLMCVLGWLNHPGVRFQFSTRGWTATGHPLQLNTIVIDLSQLVCHNFCADISDSQQCTYFFLFWGNNAATLIIILLNQWLHIVSWYLISLGWFVCQTIKIILCRKNDINQKKGHRLGGLRTQCMPESSSNNQSVCIHNA
jgi:hypothetical protein